MLEDAVQSNFQFYLYEGIDNEDQYKLMLTENLGTVLFSAVITLIGSIYKYFSLITGYKMFMPGVMYGKDSFIYRCMLLGNVVIIISNLLRIVNLAVDPDNSYAIYFMFMTLSLLAFFWYSLALIVHLAFYFTKSTICRTVIIFCGIIISISLFWRLLARQCSA